MSTNTQAFDAASLFADRITDRRYVPRFPLMISAWIWRANSPCTPIAIRVLDHSDRGVGFICPIPLDADETIDLALDRVGPRHSGLHVIHCESLGEDTFRIGVQTGAPS